MASENKTVADILAEMKRTKYGDEDCSVKWCLHKWADRLEAAAKRDEERAIEHATRHAEAVASDNCRDCVHNPEGKNYEGGNAAAMREALMIYEKQEGAGK